MLTLGNATVSRRQFLRIGGLGATGLTWADVLRQRALAKTSERPKSVIMVFLAGGMSHIDTYDMKPAAPVEFRGDLRPIRTNVPGIDICESLVGQARMMDKFAIVRDLRFHNELPNDHDPHEVFTGLPPKARRPSFGAIVNKLRSQPTDVLPSYISLVQNDLTPLGDPESPLYLGLANRPFKPTGADLPNLEMRVRPERLQDRVHLMRGFDDLRRDIDRRGEMVGMDEFSRRALAMVTSPAIRDALDIEKEPVAVRDRYGSDKSMVRPTFNTTLNWPASQFLRARRLVEVGVPVVTVSCGSWDHHGVLSNGPGCGIFERLRAELPLYDRSICALVDDLHQRGLANDVAVVIWGEMGRTPRINHQQGRDHWQDSGFVLLAGGGFRTGQVIGATDRNGARPRGIPHTAQHVFATLYRHLGIDSATTLTDFTGRPQFLLDDREPIRELL